MSETTQGTRLPDAVMTEPGPGWEAWNRGHCAPGSYMKVTTRTGNGWYIVDPAGRPGSIWPKHHHVEEHEDGTITVSPSLANRRAGYDHESFAVMVPSDDPMGWHGWLERGVWRSC